MGVSNSAVVRLLLVTDRRLSGDLPGAVARALSGAPPGEVGVILREKDLPGRPLLALARRLREVTAGHQAPLLVADRADVARAAGADGVHLPARGLPPVDARRLLGPEAWITHSVHGPGDLEAARGHGRCG